MKQEVLDKINELIAEEKGRPVTVNNILSDANLDSLGIIFFLTTLDAEYNLMWSMEELPDLNNITIRELVTKCVISKKMSDAANHESN